MRCTPHTPFRPIFYKDRALFEIGDNGRTFKKKLNNQDKNCKNTRWLPEQRSLRKLRNTRAEP